ncbi:hypothetical protein ANO11243_037880 [Dothideomycetidae sp. 11243]|nr:hypothetical protein ANO11243_037880 [fungal sp. No.11243]
MQNLRIVLALLLVAATNAFGAALLGAQGKVRLLAFMREPSSLGPATKVSQEPTQTLPVSQVSWLEDIARWSGGRYKTAKDGGSGGVLIVYPAQQRPPKTRGEAVLSVSDMAKEINLEMRKNEKIQKTKGRDGWKDLVVD